MFSTKKNVLQTVAMLKAFDISHVIISPGSRNSPLSQSFVSDSFFKCHSIVDERSAGFYAIGLINKLLKPVALCCTSGSALLNYGPAVAEAFYQELPLVIISADRSPAWIGQMDGQTIPQIGVFNSLVKKSVQIPEINNDEELWYCNRLLNETLIECTNNGNGPVHINVPISEPLFDFSCTELPTVRKINNFSAIKGNPDESKMIQLEQIWKKSNKRMILIGQGCPGNYELLKLSEQLCSKNECIVLSEHLGNIGFSGLIGNFDALISTFNEKEYSEFAPDLLITIGGHIVSKRIRKLIRKHAPENHWHFSESGKIPDTFKSLTHLLDATPASLLENIINRIGNVDSSKNEYVLQWTKKSEILPEPGNDLPFSDVRVTGKFLRLLPAKSTLMVGNSSSVRNIQLFPLDKSINVFCNRGTNGIEGSVSTAIGYSTIHNGQTYLLVGDLSFFYDINSIWNGNTPDNLHILLINNGGGGIFHLLPGLEKADSMDKFVSASHSISAENWVKASGLDYLKADSDLTYDSALLDFIKTDRKKPVVLEVFTDFQSNRKASDTYYSNIKNK